MPLDYLQINAQIKAYALHAVTHQNALRSLLDQYSECLPAAAAEQSSLREKIRELASRQKNLRCALPGEEPLNAVIPFTNGEFTGTLAAVDGSQIIPSRHRQVEFGAINIAVVVMRVGSGLPPDEQIISRLIDRSLTSYAGDSFSEGFIALLRDLEERRVLRDHCSSLPAPVITLTDGPMELFREPQASKDYERVLQEYKQILLDLKDRAMLPAGYVDKPGSDLVIRMLNYAGVSGTRIPDQLLPDRILFKVLLRNYGDRSAVFSIQTGSADAFEGDIAVHFFYLNNSHGSNPHLARVEIPAWVAQTPHAVDLVRSALLNQCAAMNPAYPYLLHRAHEVAVVSFAEIDHLEELIVAELQLHDIAPEDASAKQAHKNNSQSGR